jgi:vacuolar-type H+-ATPase subunit D/Vma8
MDTGDFRAAVTTYVDLHDEIAAAAKQLATLRKKKDAIGDLIVEFMKRSNIDECELQQGGKLVRKESKRTEALKKEHIVAELMALLHNDSTRAQSSLENIYAKRGTETKDVLSRTKR